MLRLSMVLLCASCGAAPLHRLAIQHNAEGADDLARGRLEEAEARFRLATEYNDTFSEPWNNLGLVAMQREQLDDALRFFETAIDLREDFAEAWNNVGVLV